MARGEITTAGAVDVHDHPVDELAEVGLEPRRRVGVGHDERVELAAHRQLLEGYRGHLHGSDRRQHGTVDGNNVTFVGVDDAHATALQRRRRQQLRIIVRQPEDVLQAQILVQSELGLLQTASVLFALDSRLLRRRAVLLRWNVADLLVDNVAELLPAGVKPVDRSRATYEAHSLYPLLKCKPIALVEQLDNLAELDGAERLALLEQQEEEAVQAGIVHRCGRQVRRQLQTSASKIRQYQTCGQQTLETHTSSPLAMSLLEKFTTPQCRKYLLLALSAEEMGSMSIMTKL